MPNQLALSSRNTPEPFALRVVDRICQSVFTSIDEIFCLQALIARRGDMQAAIADCNRSGRSYPQAAWYAAADTLAEADITGVTVRR